MDEGRRELLLARHLAGRLTEEETRELAEYARSSPEAAREVARHLVLHRALIQAGRPPIDIARFMAALPAGKQASVDKVMRSIRRVPSRARLRTLAVWGTGLTLAAAAVIALVVGVRRGREGDSGEPIASLPPASSSSGPSADPGPRGPARDPATLARLDRMTGRVFVLANGARDPALATRPLLPGDGLLTVGRGSSASVSYADGTRIEVGGDTVIAQLGLTAKERAKSVVVARGDLLGHIAPQPASAPMVFVSPHAEAVVLGTRLAMAVTPQTTRVDVHEGRLRVSAGRAGDAVEVAAGRYALVREGEAPALAEQPRGGLALFVTGSMEGMLNLADQAVHRRLQGAGFEVRVLASGGPSLISDALGAALVVVSSTVASADVDPRLNQVPVPILTWEPELYDDLGMTGPCEQGDCGLEPGRHGLLIKDSAHPLAAGLSGQVMASRHGSTTAWGSPGANAIWVATLAGNPTRALVFGYERGAPMPSLASAPARRVGFFMGDDTASGLTDAGWALFDAAVAWCAARPARP